MDSFNIGYNNVKQFSNIQVLRLIVKNVLANIGQKNQLSPYLSEMLSSRVI